MKLKLKIRQKISLFILGTTFIIFAIIIGYFSVSSRNEAQRNVTELMDSHADHYGTMVESWLNRDMATVRSLATAFHAYRQLPFVQWRQLTESIYPEVLENNPNVDGIWDSWDFNSLDDSRYDPDAYTSLLVQNEHGIPINIEDATSIDHEPSIMNGLMSTYTESILEPYTSNYSDAGLITSLVSPIINQGEQVGVVGIDVSLDRFQAIVCGIKPYPESYAFLLSHNGMFVSHPDTAIYTKTIDQVYPDLNRTVRFAEMVKRGERFNFTYTSPEGNQYYFSISPIEVGQAQTPWAFGIALPTQAILFQTNRNFNIGLLVGFVGLIVLAVVVYILSGNILKPIRWITGFLEDLAKGRIVKSDQIKVDGNDEIGQMGRALAQSMEGLDAKTQFAINIGKGELDAELKLLSDDDTLGSSLIDMRNSLREAQEEDLKRKEEDKKRSWVNEGLAKFGDILRQNNDNMSLLGDEVIKNLVWYLKANLGGVFIVKEESEPLTLDLVAAFAYDRKRHLKRSFELGEGLIGACAAEKETIFVTKIPDDYIEVTSGLGETKPKSLLIIPLKIEEDVLGVIELASLNVFKPFEIEFVEKLAQSISSTLKTVSINQRTNELLQKSQEQAEIMTAQEEEMRQNMEELQATQEEAARKASEMESLIDALNRSSFIVEYDLGGTIINISEVFLDFLGITREEAVGRQHTDNLVLTPDQKNQYEEFWNNLRRGVVQKQITQLNVKDRNITLQETYAPIKHSTGEVFKILKICTDITDVKA